MSGLGSRSGEAATVRGLTPLRLLALAPWILVLEACPRPLPLYEGAERPLEELAIFDAAEPCKVLQIDDREVPHMENRFALEPGPHWLSFQVRRRYRDDPTAALDGQVSTNCMAYVDMQPGHTYSVRSYFERTLLEPRRSDVLFESTVRLVVELEDTTTGELVEDLVCE